MIPIRSRRFIPRCARGSAAAFDGADAAADARLAGDRARRVDADPRADRQRQDADRVSLVPRSADVHARAAESAAAAACCTSRRSRRSPSTSSATCARRSPASRRSPTARGDAVRRAGDRDPHRRHAAGRARAVPARAGRHPDHDAGVALPAADLERARRAPRRSTRSSSTRSTRSCRPSAARTSRCRSSGSRRSASAPPQRIGLSATQRPLDEVARFLGGVETPAAGRQRRARAAPLRQAAARAAPSARTDARDRDRRRVRRAPRRRPLPPGHHRRRRRRRRR